MMNAAEQHVCLLSVCDLEMQGSGRGLSPAASCPPGVLGQTRATQVTCTVHRNPSQDLKSRELGESNRRRKGKSVFKRKDPGTRKRGEGKYHFSSHHREYLRSFKYCLPPLIGQNVAPHKYSIAMAVTSRGMSAPTGGKALISLLFSSSPIHIVFLFNTFCLNIQQLFQERQANSCRLLKQLTPLAAKGKERCTCTFRMSTSRGLRVGGSVIQGWFCNLEF